MSKREIEGLKAGIIQKKDAMFRKFDDFLYKREEDYSRAKNYFKELKDSLSKIQKVISRLNEKVVNNEKEISNLEYNYRLKEQEDQRLRKLYREIPFKLKEIAVEKRNFAKKIARLLRESRAASVDLNKASGLINTLEQAVKKHDVLVKDLKKEVEGLKRKRKILNTIDWTKEELIGPRTEMSIFLRKVASERKKKEAEFRRERSRLNRLLNSKLKKELMKLINE